MNNPVDVSYDQIFIGGAWTAPSSNEKILVVDPSTEEVIGHVPAGNANDIDRAVTAARRAFDEGPWPRMPGAARAQVLRRIATLLREKASSLARLEVLDTGKPLPEADWDVADSAGCFDYFAGLAEATDSEKPEQIAVPDQRFIAEVVKEPLGVIAAITPWNNPLLMLSWKVAPALAAGCTVVAKPSEFTSLTALELAAIAREAGVSEGALNIVTGTGPAAGQPLSQHPLVDKTTFTGSVPTGAKVMNAAAADIKKIGLELGGKSALIMFEDADLENAVEWILFGVFWNQGQICSATTRALIHHSIYDKVVARVVEEARKIRIGNGLDSTTQLGPLVSSVQYQKVVAAVENAKREGAKVLTGGRRPPGFDKGYYFEPTILADAPLDSKAWTDEIFGPVLCVRPFETEAEAIKLANDSKYGLAGAVMTADEERAARVANSLRVGLAWINCSQPAFLETPWGGYKQSGIGREMGRWGFDSYRETKQILRFRKGERWGWYLK